MRPIILVPVFLFIALRALAEASVPDPLWVPGLYDDADGDAEVLQALAITGSSIERPPDARPSTTAVSQPVAPDSCLSSSPSGRIAAARAPPP